MSASAILIFNDFCETKIANLFKNIYRKALLTIYDD